MRVHRLFSSVSSLAAVSRNPEAVKVGPLHFRRTCHQQPTLGKCLQVLDLSSSPDLVCHNLMCESQSFAQLPHAYTLVTAAGSACMVPPATHSTGQATCN